MADTVIIEVGLNDNQTGDANPHVPYSADELAADAREPTTPGQARAVMGAPVSSDAPDTESTPRKGTPLDH